MLVASVIVDIATRALDRPFNYLVPPQLAPSAQVGCAVSVDFGNRPVVGYIIELAEMDEARCAAVVGDISKLKPLLGVLSEPYFDSVSASLATSRTHVSIVPFSLLYLTALLNKLSRICRKCSGLPTKRV